MSEEQVPWADWLEAFGMAARHPLGIEYEGDPQMDYRDAEELIDGCGTPPDQATAVKVKRYLVRVTGILSVDIVIPPPPSRYHVTCNGLHKIALLGSRLPSSGYDLIVYLNGHEAMIGMVDDAMKADYLSEGEDFADWEEMKLDLHTVARSLTYRSDGLILTILVDYDAAG